jgi:hypothetical protein
LNNSSPLKSSSQAEEVKIDFEWSESLEFQGEKIEAQDVGFQELLRDLNFGFYSDQFCFNCARLLKRILISTSSARPIVKLDSNVISVPNDQN